MTFATAVDDAPPGAYDPIAAALIGSYLETAGYSKGFRDDHGQPPTKMSKSHHFLSVLQATINRDDRFQLGEEYAEFGRVEYEDSGKRYLVRSYNAFQVQTEISQSFFGSSTGTYIESPVVLLIHKFHKNGLDLSIAGSKQLEGHSHLDASASATYVGTWDYATASTGSFDQGASDAFDELNELGEEEGGDAAGGL